MPDNSKEFATGDEVCLYGKVTANDDNGLSVEVARVERDDTEAEPEAAADAGGEEDAGAATGASESDTGEPSSATNYVMKRRRQMAVT